MCAASWRKLGKNEVRTAQRTGLRCAACVVPKGSGLEMQDTARDAARQMASIVYLVCESRDASGCIVVSLN